MSNILSGTYKGSPCRLQVECYPKTAEVKVTLVPVNGNAPLVLTQNLGQSMPLYQAFLSDGLLDLNDNGFMEFMEENGLGYIVDYKKYDRDVFTGCPRRLAAVFQFERTALQKFDPIGCRRFERHYASQELKLRHPKELVCAARA